METLTAVVTAINNFVWGPPMLVLILGTGLYLQLRLGLMPVLRIATGFRMVWKGRKAEAGAEGEITPYAALMTALAATVGTGNIAGVATAIAIGGPGAMFWMWMTALVGMATKYAEVLLAVHYRETDDHGEHVGGPMFAIKNGLGKNWRWLGAAFAIFGGLAGFGIGNMVQSNSIAQVLHGSFGVTIEGLETAGGEITGVRTDQGVLTADRYVLALGSYSTRMLEPIGIRVPVYPVKGFSITVPIVDPAMAPTSTIMDETHKVAVTRLGDRIRVGGTAQLSGFNLDLEAGRRRTLEFVVTDLFPKGGDVSRATFWTGLRPMTPDGTPILGGTKYGNLYLSTGHGTLGWTMAAGTGRVMADLIGGATPEISLEGLTVDRYR
jgi:hypothetical protein